MAGPRVYLGIGSNVGDRAMFVKSACDSLQTILRQFEQASLYETVPRDFADQPHFLNTVVTGFTPMPPDRLLREIHEIERAHGRDRANERTKGPRTLDIDLLLYGTETIETDDLTVPHPRMTERKFVLLPLLELDPLLRHPLTGVAFESYLESLEPQGIYYFPATGYSRGISGHRHHHG